MCFLNNVHLMHCLIILCLHESKVTLFGKKSFKKNHLLRVLSRKCHFVGNSTFLWYAFCCRRCWCRSSCLRVCREYEVCTTTWTREIFQWPFYRRRRFQRAWKNIRHRTRQTFPQQKYFHGNGTDGGQTVVRKILRIDFV